MKYYDSQRNALVYIGQEPTPEFWDEHWAPSPELRQQILSTPQTFVSEITQKYLQPSDGPILEGGCGLGQHVASLQNAGYTSIGVDLAPATVRALNKHMPELDIREADVRNLPFEENSLAGVWSLGVIEHFWDGFDEVVTEMHRVLKPQGLAFVTFPYMSPLRRFKARIKRYPKWEGAKPEDFYQFALDHKEVGKKICEAGFQVYSHHTLGKLKGLKDESGGPVQSLLRRLYNYEGRNLALRGTRKALGSSFGAVAAHSILIVFRKD
jgi:SAM-dependent methyltransferase